MLRITNTVLMGTGPGEAYAGDEAIGGTYCEVYRRLFENREAMAA